VTDLPVSNLPVSGWSGPESSGGDPPAAARLLVCLYPETLAVSLQTELQAAQYRLLRPQSPAEFFEVVAQQQQQIDCLILQDDGQSASPSSGQSQLAKLVGGLQQQATLLPAVLFGDGAASIQYHGAQVALNRPIGLIAAIDQAMCAFLNLPAAAPAALAPGPIPEFTTQSFLMKQRQLAEKLKERLGYLGVYYKRSPRNFLRNMAVDEQADFLAELKTSYRDIILAYFSEVPSLNQKIDNYIDIAFFADISVAQVVEIHMELMGEFSKQLKLEGRSEEVLLDYRLTLIDTLAHLCEMYRRSIPQESPGP
jgi:circadian clock protein KaiA